MCIRDSDICAVNTVLNILAQKNNLKYDDGGNLAKMGNLIVPLSEKLKSLDFYSKRPPKSLGIEWVYKEIYPILKQYEDRKTEDLQQEPRGLPDHLKLHLVL